MANDLIITPENISSIRYSYKPNSSSPFAIKNFASIAVITTGGQYLNIGLGEVLTYIKMLELKALMLNNGTSVIAVESTDVENYTSIELGIPTGDNSFPVAVRLSVLQDDVCTSSVSIVYINHSGSITEGDILYVNSGLTIPVQGFDFVSDVNTGVIFSILDENTGEVGSDIAGVSCPVNPLGKKYLVMMFAEPTNPADTIDSINDASNTIQLPIVTRAGYVNSYPLDGQSINRGQAIMVDISSQPDEDSVTLILSKSAASAWSYSVVAYGNTAIVTNIGDSVPVTNQPYTIQYDARNNGFVVVNIFSGASLPVTGIPVNASAANSSLSSDVCTATAVTYYTDDGTITTGKTVYTDISLTTPLSGFTFINSPDGNIYAIDNVTGVVGAASGNTCTPPAAKNVFVINNSGQPIVITTSQGSQAFAPAMNANIGVAAADTITNDSVTTRTFTLYTSSPFIPANKDADESPNPFTLTPTTGKLLSADITNLNYIIVT